MKLWNGRTSGETSNLADKFNSSIMVDKRLYKQDIIGSIAHTKMLGEKGIISKQDEELLVKTLQEVLKDLEEGKIEIDLTAEDIHMFIEQIVTNKIGEVGKKIHTARSRNDQVTLDLRLYLVEQIKNIIGKIKIFVETLTNKAQEHKQDIMPGYTHMQRAQAVTFGQHLLCYDAMLLRDIDRFNDLLKRVNISPIGSCALAGTTFDTDRFYEAKLLNMDDVCFNSMDGVSDRDYCVEFLSNCSILMMHLSRFCEELVLWSSCEFQFIEFSDDFTTGSSIMPQKKNPDMAELIRGKTGRVYGNLFALLTILKGLPLAYNKDMQEDKEQVFDSLDTVIDCLDILPQMINTMKVFSNNMYIATKKGFINATDVADYLVTKGLPFRTAYKISGEIVNYSIKNNKTLEELSLEIYKSFSNLFENDLFDKISLQNCVNKRLSYGGTSIKSVENQIELVRKKLEKI